MSNKCAVDIKSMYDFLKNTNECSDSYNEEVNIPINTVDNHDCENILNTNIREEEVLAAVKQLKNNKAAGYGRVLNEHISSTVSIFLSLYTKLFNLIFDT